MKSLRTLSMTSHLILQLLGELLLEPLNVRVMVKYVADVHNLILMMNLLKDQYDSIQFEAFHVFKVPCLCVAFELVYFMG